MINNKDRIGKYSYYVSYIFRFLAILLILTPFIVATKGIGGIIAIIFYKIILKAVPFKISLYKDYIALKDNKLKLEDFYLLAFIIISISLILINDENQQDRIFFTLLLLILILISIPQIVFLIYVKKTFIKNFKPEVIKIELKVKKPFSLYNFYFDEGTNINKKNKLLENAKIYSKQLKFGKLKKDEIIIISIISGLLIGLFLGSLFGATIYTDFKGRKFSEDNDSIVFVESQYNYVWGFVSFIITSGICYIYIQRKNENQINANPSSDSADLQSAPATISK